MPNGAVEDQSGIQIDGTEHRDAEAETQPPIFPPEGPEAQQHQRYTYGGEKVVEPPEI